MLTRPTQASQALRRLAPWTLSALVLALSACGGGQSEVSTAPKASSLPEGPSIKRKQAFGVQDTAAPLVGLNRDFRMNLTAVAAEGAVSWRLADGRLPEGLRLEPSGQVSGRALTAGEYWADIEAVDATGQVARSRVRFTVVMPDGSDAPVADSPTQWAGRTSPARAATEASPNRGIRATASDGTPLAELPELVSALAAVPEGSWVKVNANLFSSVWTPSALRVWEPNLSGVGFPSSLIGAWSGFAWDTRRGDLLIYGGGHANYGGNEVYRWRGSTRQWERASLPSDIRLYTSGTYHAIDGPDRAPAAAHTYDNNVYLPVVDRFLVLGGAGYNNGGAFLRDNGAGASRITGPYLWDPAKADPMKVGGSTGSHVKRVAPYPEVIGGDMWQNRDARLNLPTASLPNNHVEGCTGYASEGGKDVVYLGARPGGGTATHLYRYVVNDLANPAADTWTKVGGWWDTPQGQTVCAYDPVQRLMVRLGSKSRPFIFWDVNTAQTGANGNADRTIGFTESSGELLSLLAAGTLEIDKCGFDFDPIRRQYVLWCGANHVWRLTPPAAVSNTGWVLTRQPAAQGATPTGLVGVGVLGKWKYIPNLDAFMALQNSTEGHVWLYKPVGWQPPGGEPAPVNQVPTVAMLTPANASVVQPGEPLTVSASASDSDGSVARVEILENDVVVASLTQAPWQTVRQAPASGSVRFAARATDNQGAMATSATVTVQVQQPNQPPTVAIATPTAGQSFVLGQPISISANASDPEGQIASVTFYDNGVPLITLTQAPWVHSWSNAALGSHTVSASVIDAGGLSVLSAGVSVLVEPAPEQGATITKVLQNGLDGYTATRDSMLYRWWPSTVLGTRTAMSEEFGDYTPVVRFAIFAREGGPIPDSATIVSAQLGLFKSTSSYDATLSAYRLLCNWEEASVTWTNCRAGVPWAAGGAAGTGDGLTAADGNGSVGWGSGWLSINVGAGLVAMQQGAINNGWRLRRTGGNGNLKNFWSRDYASDPSLRPKLTVTYRLN